MTLLQTDRLVQGFAILLALSLPLIGCNRQSDTAAQPKMAEARPHAGEEQGHAAEGEAHQEDAALALEALAPRGVKTAKVDRRALSETLRAPAEIRFNEQRRAVVSARTAGWVERLAVFANQPVRKHALLAEIHSPEFSSAQQEYLLIAERARNDGTGEASRLLADAAQRLRLLGLTDEEIRELEASREPLKDQHVHSPIGGIVIEHKVAVGDTVQPGQPLFVVADLSSVWARLSLNESQIPQVRAGAPVILTTSAYPDRRFKGTVLSLGAEVDEATRTVSARASVENPGALLKPGMFADAEIAVGNQKSVLAVPEAAVIQLEGRPTVFKVEDGNLHPEPVKVGTARGGQVEILEGLAPGDEIAVEGVFLLKSLILKSQMGEGHAH